MERAAMRRRAARGGSGSKPKPKSSFLSPPTPAAAGGSASPTSPVDFRFLPSAKGKTSSAKPKPKPPLASPASDAIRASASPLTASAVSSVGDLKSLASSHLDSLKRRLDLLHSDALKDLDASHSRISKRFKIQTQACLQLTDEVDNEYKKMSDRIKESAEIIKTSYKEIMAGAQSSTSRVCKVTIPEMTKSVEKTIDSLRSRYNIPVIPV